MLYYHYNEIYAKEGQADADPTDPQLAAELKKKRTFRTFSYRGVELEKLLDMSNEDVRPLNHLFTIKHLMTII